MGDMKYNTVVWIPSIKTLYGSDVLFNQAHPFTCEVTAEERQQWIQDIERLENDGRGGDYSRPSETGNAFRLQFVQISPRTI